MQKVTYTDLTAIVTPAKEQGGGKPVELFNFSWKDDYLDHSVKATYYPDYDWETQVYPYIEVTYQTPANDRTVIYEDKQRKLQELAREVNEWIAQEITPYQ